MPLLMLISITRSRREKILLFKKYYFFILKSAHYDLHSTHFATTIAVIGEEMGIEDK